MKRILLVSMHGEIAGAEKSLLLLASHLSARYDVKAACPVPSPLAGALGKLGCECFALARPCRSRWRSLRGMLHLAESSVRVSSFAALVCADIVHANTLPAAVVSLPAAAFGRTSLLWHARDVKPPAFASRLVGRFSSHVIAVSRWVRQNIIAQGVPPHKVSVVYNGVESPAAPAPCDEVRKPESEPASEGDSFVFGNVGQFVPWKKQMLFLDAAERVAREMPHARFLLVGDDIFGRNADYARELRTRASTRALRDKLSLAGWCSDMASVYASMDCLVHTADGEPFGRALIEAMAAGVPVIAADAGGPSEIVKNGLSGLLVAPNDVAATSEAMLRIAKEPGLAARLSRRARAEVSVTFTAAEASARVDRIYAGLLTAGAVRASDR